MGLLPQPVGGDIGFVTLSLAALSAPAALGLLLWSPIVIAGGLAIAAGVGAATPPRDAPATAAHRRLGLAGLLGLYATAASAPRLGATTLILGAILAAGVLIAAIGHWRTTFAVVPGVATAAALAAGPGAAATLAGQRSERGGVSVPPSPSPRSACWCWRRRGGGTRWGPAPRWRSDRRRSASPWPPSPSARPPRSGRPPRRWSPWRRQPPSAPRPAVAEPPSP